jgi:hypothetical protein
VGTDKRSRQAILSTMPEQQGTPLSRRVRKPCQPTIRRVHPRTRLVVRGSGQPQQSGSISLYDAPPEYHESVSHHICDSEYPEPVIARSVKKNKWKERDGRPDNDWFDTLVGCLALASMCGAYLRSDASNFQQPRPVQSRKLSSIWQQKQRKA